VPQSRPLWLILAPVIFLLLWSGGYTVAKIGLQYAPPMKLLALRFGFVVAMMTVLFVVLRPPLPKTRNDWMHLAIVGVLIQTVYFGLGYMAFVNGIAAGTAALIMSLQPIAVALIAPRWSGEAIGWRQWGGLLLALSGTAIVILARMDIGPAPVLGFVLAGLGLAGIVSGSLWEKRFGVTHHPVTANLVGYSAGLICLLPFVFLENGAPVAWSWPFIWALGYLVIGNSVIAVGLLLAMIRAGEVNKVSAQLFLVPPMAALIAWISLGELMPPLAWLGLVLAGVGVYLATRK
jgi:drug/metabolite transporter (DMT)-like permease